MRCSGQHRATKEVKTTASYYLKCIQSSGLFLIVSILWFLSHCIIVDNDWSGMGNNIFEMWNGMGLLLMRESRFCVAMHDGLVRVRGQERQNPQFIVERSVHRSTKLQYAVSYITMWPIFYNFSLLKCIKNVGCTTWIGIQYSVSNGYYIFCYGLLVNFLHYSTFLSKNVLLITIIK